MKKSAVSVIAAMVLATFLMSCVSLEDRKMSFQEWANANIVGSVTVAFNSWQFMHIIGKKRIRANAYRELKMVAQNIYQSDVEIYNITIKGEWSDMQRLNIVLYVLGGWVFGAGLLLPGNTQRIIATGDVVLLDGSSIPFQAMSSENTLEQVTERNQRNSPRQSRESIPVPQLGQPNILQQALNQLPAIPIAGNNLKFQFGGNVWIATVNGENFSTGTIGLEDTNDGSILTLKQTHIWPGTVGRTAGRVANRIPGGAAVGGTLDTAGRVAGTVVGAIEASGPDIVLEYKAGPPTSLRLLTQ